MSVTYNKDGSVTFTDDSNPSRTQVVPTGTTRTQCDYLASVFFGPPVNLLDPLTILLQNYALKSDSALLPGIYKLANGLPSASLYQGHYVFVSDLGGGPDVLLSDGTNWRRIHYEVIPQIINASSNINIVSLVNSSVVKLSSNATFNSASTISLTGAYPGQVQTLIIPNGVFGTTATLGININAASTLSPFGINLSGVWADIGFDGTASFKIRGGTL